MASKDFKFEISLSTLEHLGHGLYRNFATILGEAISNAWDADAENVWIYIDRKDNSFFIKDDGIGMSTDDFQNKFLKIGYSKRTELGSYSNLGRPYVGRKGIGKLALLSCAEKISIISKTDKTDYDGGLISNPRLKDAIRDNLIPEEYSLEEIDLSKFKEHTDEHSHGTIIYFENIENGIKNRLEYLRKIIALYFRFSLCDNKFKIFVNDEQVNFHDLGNLSKNTQLLWRIGTFEDPYISDNLKDLQQPIQHIELGENIRGFIASTVFPRHLSIFGTAERAGIDLFVNGRLRERNIIKHIPTARIAESYYYGQIHFDNLDGSDDDVDRFTTSREGIIESDSMYQEFLNILRGGILKINDNWDKLRKELRQDGDPENKSITEKDRKAEELANISIREYALPKGSPNFDIVEKWCGDLHGDAIFNLTSYIDCFISENLLREYIAYKNIKINPKRLGKNKIEKNIAHYMKKENANKKAGNISIDIRKYNSQHNTDLSYLGMDDLVRILKKKLDNYNSLYNDAKSYKPIRDAMAHTARLTDTAKRKLRTIYENIKGKLKNFLEN